LKIVILTSSLDGIVAYYLPLLTVSKKMTISGVVLLNNTSYSQVSFLKRQVRKILKIGVLGAINGIRMRKWYKKDVSKFLRFSDLRTLCSDQNIPLYEVDNGNPNEVERIIKSLSSDLGVSAENSYISEKIFSIPKLGMINIHHELLPEYQNAQSIIWQIYNRSNTTGFTIHKINKYIDEGDILYQKEIEINLKQRLSKTVTYNYSKLWEASAVGLLDLLENYKHYDDKSFSQGKGNKYTTPTFNQMVRIYRNFYQLKRAKKSRKELE